MRRRKGMAFAAAQDRNLGSLTLTVIVVARATTPTVSRAHNPVPVLGKKEANHVYVQSVP
jgi:hypothetical protein